jgi:hypothetical protein
MLRILAVLASLLTLAACGETRLDEPPEDLGAFKMRVSHVYTDKALKWPLSRDAKGADWNKAMETALEARLRRYQGSQEYDVAVTLEGFMLAPPGIPVLVSPKSAVVVNVFVYDVAQKKYLARKHQMQVFESTTGESALLGSGHARTRDEQIAGLALNIADELEEYLAEQHTENGWFDLHAAADQPEEAAADQE